MFTGWVFKVPDEENFTTSTEDKIENRRRFCRRFNSDKIQSAQLITEEIDGYQQFMVIIQFNDCIMAASLNTHKLQIICQSEAMIRKHMVRGYFEKIFYCESHGSTEKVIQLEFNSLSKNSIVKKELWQLNGSQIVAFQLDDELIINE